MLDDLLDAIVADPLAEDRYLVLADWLEEHDDPRRAELLRLHRRLLGTCCEPERHPERAVWQARIVELLGLGVRPCVPQRTVVLGKGMEMCFAFIPPGTFLMGSPASEGGWFDNETLHRVPLTRGFWMGTHAVTQRQWLAVTRTRPSHFEGGDRPVERVLWAECREFCATLGEKAGATFRLPTEAEWEYACRAGTTTPFHFGETICTEQANHKGNSASGPRRKVVCREQTTPVGSFPPNAWGLYDTHGNVWEWCQDWFAPLPTKDQKDPAGSKTGDARVVRGGSWADLAETCNSGCRHGFYPNLRYENGGCRVLLSCQAGKPLSSRTRR